MLNSHQTMQPELISAEVDAEQYRPARSRALWSAAS